MNKKIISDLIKFLCVKYPYPNELSKARLTKLIYLIDWESSKRKGFQVTDIEWYFDSFGPFVSDVYDIADEDSNIKVTPTTTVYGSKKILISYNGDLPEFPKDIKEIAEEVINDTKHLNFDDFIKYVYSTLPIKNSSKYSYLNFSDFH